MEWSQVQMQELENLSRRHHVPHVRIKALALINVARGMKQQEVAALVGVGRTTVWRWVKSYRSQGPAGFAVAPGRGRPTKVVPQEVENYLRQSPRHFGVAQTRWTLRALARVVPSLKGMTDAGVYYALERLGFRYKRGQPHLHSPDPQYEEKRGAWYRPLKRPESIPQR